MAEDAPHMPDQEVEEILDEETGDGHLMVRTARRDLPASWGARNQKYRARLARAPARARGARPRSGACCGVYPAYAGRAAVGTG